MRLATPWWSCPHVHFGRRKLYASLDVLTGGRVIAGVGTGSMFRDYEVVGMDHRDMWPRFEEGVRRCGPTSPPARSLSGQILRYQRRQLGADTRAKAQPADLDRSWGSHAGLRRVARLRDGWLSPPAQTPSPEQFAEDVKRLNAFLVQEGKDPATFPKPSPPWRFYLRGPRELARVGGPAMSQGQPASGRTAGRRPLEDAHAHDMVGTRAACIDKVRRWKAVVPTHSFSSPVERTPGAMRLLCIGGEPGLTRREISTRGHRPTPQSRRCVPACADHPQHEPCVVYHHILRGEERHAGRPRAVPRLLLGLMSSYGPYETKHS